MRCFDIVLQQEPKSLKGLYVQSHPVSGGRTILLCRVHFLEKQVLRKKMFQKIKKLLTFKKSEV